MIKPILLWLKKATEEKNINTILFWLKWVLYTFIIGLLPIFLRFIIYNDPSKTSPNVLYPYQSSDILVFGLLLNITMINEILNNKIYDDDNFLREKKIIFIGINLLLIIFITAFYCLSLSDRNNYHDNVEISFILVIVTLFANIMHLYTIKKAGDKN